LISPAAIWEWARGLAVEVIAPLMSSGVAFGWRSIRIAAIPEVRAVDIEVPLPRK